MVNKQKILVIAPAWIGDMVMAEVLFKILKQRNPKTIIHVLAPAWTSPLLQFMPEVAHIINSPFKHGELKLSVRYKLAKKLRQENYTQAIILPNSFKAALIPFWAKIPRRTGWRGEMRYGLINDLRILNKEKLPLMIQRFAALGLDKDAVLPVDLPWPEFNVTIKEEKKIIALCPGAEYGPSKRWPAEYFAQLAQYKLDQGWQVWIFGSRKDHSIAATIQKLTNNRCRDLTGKTDLLQAVNLLAAVSLVITNDTGLMHIAAALNKRLIALYGSSSPQFTPPLTKKATIISLNLSCSPCFKRQCPLKIHQCMRDLTFNIVKTKL